MEHVVESRWHWSSVALLASGWRQAGSLLVALIVAAAGPENPDRGPRPGRGGPGDGRSTLERLERALERGDGRAAERAWHDAHVCDHPRAAGEREWRSATPRSGSGTPARDAEGAGPGSGALPVRTVRRAGRAILGGRHPGGRGVHGPGRHGTGGSEPPDRGRARSPGGTRPAGSPRGAPRTPVRGPGAHHAAPRARQPVSAHTSSPPDPIPGGSGAGESTSSRSAFSAACWSSECVSTRAQTRCSSAMTPPFATGRPSGWRSSSRKPATKRS